MKPVAIIPARGGSKRIPGKNIKPFGGVPMIAHPIATALESGLFSRIIVSSEDEEISSIARRFGAETPFVRPPELASDHAPTAPVLAHALRWLENDTGLPGQCCLMYPATPFLTPETLLQGREILSSSGAATAFAAAEHPAPIFRALQVDGNGFAKMIWPEHMHTRSQDLPRTVYDAGQFYWCDVRAFLAEGELYARRMVPVMLSRLQAIDIDTPEDWELAEALFLAMEKQGGKSR